MNPRIETIASKMMVGQRLRMSFANNLTHRLWSGFMPRKKEITQVKNANLYSLEVYNNPSFFEQFNANTEFDKWALVEVEDTATIPQGMETFILPEGLYAVFMHKGLASQGPKTFHYIFETWIPNSQYTIDNRPHFAVMGPNYKQDDPNAEEEIWIPIRVK